MAKPVARFFEAYYTADIDVNDLFISSGTKTKMVTMDLASFDKYVFEGRNFKYEDGRLNSGIVEKISVVDKNGDVTQSITGMKIDAGQIAGDTVQEFTSGLVQRLFVDGLKFLGTKLDDELSGNMGKDILLGKGGEDVLGGGGARDMLTGGTGSDQFIFSLGMRRDTITDFDANGGVGAQDFIDGTFADATISQSGKNTIVDFGDGDVFVLLKVDASNITVDDFI